VREPTDRAFVIGLLLIALVFTVHAVYLARVIVPSQDETGTLFLGSLAVSGRIGLYDDQVIGHRAPLPFYLFGATQVLFGRSLLAGRLLAIGFGCVALLLTGLVARRIGGNLCGLLAAALLAGQGVIVAYYSVAEYHSLVSMVLLAGLFVWVSGDGAWHNVGGTAILASIFFVRTHVWPVLPFALAYGVKRSRTVRERWMLLAVTLLPPLAFFAWDVKHLKILASVTVVGRWVGKLGYLPPLYLDARPQETLVSQVWWLIRVARRYEFLVLATVVALGLVAWRLVGSRRSRDYLRASQIHLIASLFLYEFAFLFVFFHINLKWIGKYLAALLPLLTIVLGFAYSRLLDDPGLSRRFKWGVAAFLAAVMVLPIYYNRNSSLPEGSVRAADPYRLAHVAAAHLARVVPREARVFFFGSNEVYYLSGLPATYFPQVYTPAQLAVLDEHNEATVKSGFYGMPQVERWLGSEADYAVVSPSTLEDYAQLHPTLSPPKVARMRALLAERFELVDRITEYPYFSYDVYRRRGK
jgi:hypothetical protein